MFDDLFAHLGDDAGHIEPLAEGAVVLRGFARERAAELLAAVAVITAAAPFRHMVTPGGFHMAVAMTNCGPLGWVSDPRGYRYSPTDPNSGRPWPAMPLAFKQLAQTAAAAAGFAVFAPDACLINRYAPGSKLSLHQDKDETDLGAPIVSVSLGLPATFQFGGLTRSAPTARVPLRHGVVVVWGGPARLRYHGVLPIKDGTHPYTGDCRLNLSFRMTGRAGAP